jgi:hypothetical protein
MRMLITLLLTVLAVPVMAQDWQIDSYDDGSFFATSISPTGAGGFTLLCGARSPQGLSAMQTGNVEPEITPPSVLRMVFSDRDIGPPDNWGQPRQDVMIVIGTTGYQLYTRISQVT